ncbi:hypothetical protein ACFOD4_15340 [Pseudoroseomonas globiformis]|uniref:Uncharacterized protein n=1 Tax=Teichococcus globiformis TaxID=2307229 RepID=A0ABV7G173_9PROT
MVMALFSPGVLGAGQGLSVLGTGHPGRVGVTRPGSALVQDAAGAFQSAAINTPRFQGGQRLLVEEARRNGLRNPRAVGALPGLIGSGGALPTFWSFEGTAPATTILGTGLEDGLPYIDLRMQGTDTFALRMEQPNGVSCSGGQRWTASFFARLLSGSLNNVGLQVALANYSVSSQAVLNHVFEGFVPTGGGLGGQRQSISWTVPGSGTYGIANRLRLQSSGGFDLVLRLAAPQLELGATRSSPILPVAGVTAAAERAADVPIWAPLGGLGGSGTVVLAAMLPSTAGDADQGLLQVDDGTDSNRLVLRSPAGAGSILAAADRAGLPQAAVNAGTVAAGMPFRLALAWAPDGLAVCLNGGAVQTAAASLPTGLARLLAGHAGVALNRAANGEIGPITYRPARLDDGWLRALTA